MYEIHCDGCGKTLFMQEASIGINYGMDEFELCMRCSLPILEELCKLGLGRRLKEAFSSQP
jgi:hypothetical protein